MKDCLLFLHGTYPGQHLDYYKKLCRGKFTIAVDGGYNFFKKAGIFPDLLIGDLDSIRRIPRNLSSKTEVIRFASAKDKTDAELALDFCLNRKAHHIDIIQPITGEPDQFIGNLMLLNLTSRLVKRYKPEVRILNYQYEIVLLNNNKKIIDKAKGDLVSVIPLSDKIKYTCRGTEYDTAGLVLKRGQSRSLRNKIANQRAVFDISGQAFLIRQYAGNFDKKGA